MKSFDCFRAIWFFDFEFSAPSGELPEVVCMVAREYRSGETIRVTGDELRRMTEAPFDISENSLFVAYYASAEIGCFLALGWTVPARVLDLFVEFSRKVSVLRTECGRGLLGALAYYGIDGFGIAEKDEMRQLAMRGGRYTDEEMAGLLVYCESDVVSLDSLLVEMADEIDLPRALLRGRYMIAAARIERTGIPVDVETYRRLQNGWEDVKGRLISDIDSDYGVFVPTSRRAVNPNTVQGRAILDAAEQNNIDPYDLADAVHIVWSEWKLSTADYFKAKLEARRITGLTANRIAKWEDGLGRDHTTWNGLDIVARDLADRYPALGIGGGHDTGGDGDDPGVELWELLRDGTDKPPARHDPGVISEAVDIVLESRAAVVPLSFSSTKWAEFLVRNNIPWPRLESGAFDLSDQAFREMSRGYPIVAPIRELRFALSQMRLSDLAVGSDGRNRCLLSAFRSKTSRNQPSNSKFLFGPSCWLRGLIKPDPDRAIAYVDWSQQEFGIGAALSDDLNMMEAYSSGDPYLAFAIQAGNAPAGATKKTHGDVRDQFKACVLGVQYGMGPKLLAFRLGKPEALARHLLALHRSTYPDYWKWAQSAVDRAMLFGELHSVFGWTVHAGRRANARSLQNFPCQANGAEMLRLACCLATERGIRVCAPIHDAVLVEASEDEIGDVVRATQEVMLEASEVVLDGFRLRTDADVVVSPDRYMDARGRDMWERVTALLGDDGETPFGRLGGTEV